MEGVWVAQQDAKTRIIGGEVVAFCDSVGGNDKKLPTFREKKV